MAKKHSPMPRYTPWRRLHPREKLVCIQIGTRGYSTSGKEKEARGYGTPCGSSTVWRGAWRWEMLLLWRGGGGGVACRIMRGRRPWDHRLFDGWCLMFLRFAFMISMNSDQSNDECAILSRVSEERSAVRVSPWLHACRTAACGAHIPSPPSARTTSFAHMLTFVFFPLKPQRVCCAVGTPRVVKSEKEKR